MGTIASTIAATAGEVDELHIEHDARDALALEQVVGRLALEALEPALGVLDRADHPDRGDEVEHLAEQPPIRGLALAHVRPVRLDPRSERDLVVVERGDEERQLIGRGGHVGIGEHEQVGIGSQHPGPDGRALPAMGHRS